MPQDLRNVLDREKVRIGHADRNDPVSLAIYADGVRTKVALGWEGATPESLLGQWLQLSQPDGDGACSLVRLAGTLLGLWVVLPTANLVIRFSVGKLNLIRPQGGG
jgi:hypothetical protein